MLDDTALPDLGPRLAEILDAHAGLEGPLLPILHAVQAEWGFVPQPAIPVIARALNLGRAEVHGVVSFYHDFRSAPAGRHVVKLCAAESCQAQGSRALAAAVADRLGAGLHETTPDGRVTVEPVYCLGLCACGPAAMVDGRPIGRATPDAIAEAVR
jgi:formate dehydrogenase subunit gamma